MSYEIKIPIRFNDEDNQNHVNHLALIEYVAEARITFIDELVTRYPSNAEDLDYVLVYFSANFMKEVTYPGFVTIIPNIMSVGIKSIRTKYKMKNEDDTVMDAECVNVFFDKKTGDSTPIPDDLHRKIKEIGGI
jgi:acyl-CoA thioester hydrolase